MCDKHCFFNSKNASQALTEMFDFPKFRFGLFHRHSSVFLSCTFHSQLLQRNTFPNQYSDGSRMLLSQSGSISNVFRSQHKSVLYIFLDHNIFFMFSFSSLWLFYSLVVLQSVSLWGSLRPKKKKLNKSERTLLTFVTIIQPNVVLLFENVRSGVSLLSLSLLYFW